MKKNNNQIPSRRSIIWKYSKGYFLIISLAILVTVISLLSSEYISRRYEKCLNELLELNELFISIENANSSVYYYYLYLLGDNYEDYIKYAGDIETLIGQLQESTDTTYSRDVVDLFYMADTFKTQCNEFVDKIHEFKKDNGNDLTPVSFEEEYQEIQRTVQFINISFKDIYSQKLTTTKAMQEKIEATKLIINLVLISVIGLAVGIGILYYNKVMKGIAGSLKKLTDFTYTITRTRDYDLPPVVIDTKDEIALLAEAYNDMLLTINEQINQIEESAHIKEHLQKVEMENLKINNALKNSQLELLQSRINPHFLFNTLNMISKTAYIEEAEETAKLLEATADYLRYNLGKLTKTVTIQDEVKNAKDYIYIQQCRFGDRIQFLYEIEENCNRYFIPCMILQPLIENSIIHGVGAMLEGAVIIIRIYAEEERICLVVEDNGVGLPEQVQSDLGEAVKNADVFDGHIGIKNVYMRLNLFFEQDTIFKIDSSQEKTIIQISIPMME